ncbi:MAG: hypothetical protein QOH66_1704 [Actinomycetota bacterium]|jgi:hypothetical protein|nr:hypothetical protein [Actinomycetota bacterium]
MDSEQIVTEARLQGAVPLDDSEVPAATPVWEEPGFEVIEAAAEVTAYAYRR